MKISGVGIGRISSSELGVRSGIGRILCSGIGNSVA